jgi:hypothetical protein
MLCKWYYVKAVEWRARYFGGKISLLTEKRED